MQGMLVKQDQNVWSLTHAGMRVNSSTLTCGTYRKIQLRAIWQIDVSLLFVCPLIDDKSRHNIVKVAVETRAAGEWFRSKQC